MSETEIDKKKIESLLPHREPMLLIDKLINIVPLKSATAIMHVKKDAFYVQGHFPNQPVMPGVLIVEAFGQAAAALTAHGIDPKEYENKLVYLMSVDKARFRNPVIPNCELHLEIEAIRSHGRVWKYKGTAKVEGKIDTMLDELESDKRCWGVEPLNFDSLLNGVVPYADAAAMNDWRHKVVHHMLESIAQIESVYGINLPYTAKINYITRNYAGYLNDVIAALFELSGTSYHFGFTIDKHTHAEFASYSNFLFIF